jgi:hypothetical protein
VHAADEVWVNVEDHAVLRSILFLAQTEGMSGRVFGLQRPGAAEARRAAGFVVDDPLLAETLSAELPDTPVVLLAPERRHPPPERITVVEVPARGDSLAGALRRMAASLRRSPR